MSDNTSEIKEKNETNENKNQSIIVKYGIFPNILMKLGFKHIESDEDGFYDDGLILPKTYSNYLFWTSFFSLGSGLYGLYKKQYKLAIYPLTTFLTSINYWRHPENNWRRYLDQIVVRGSLVSQTIQGISMPNFHSYLITMILSTSCYPISYIYQNKYLPMTVFLHSLLHIGGNIANIILYSDSSNIIV